MSSGEHDAGVVQWEALWVGRDGEQLALTGETIDRCPANQESPWRAEISLRTGEPGNLLTTATGWARHDGAFLHFLPDDGNGSGDDWRSYPVTRIEEVRRLAHIDFDGGSDG